MALSGGMKRRVLIAKALAHEPKVLFLDEPTAGVDVELRKDMWNTVAKLKGQGVTIILTTHYIEEAEAIADRIAVINGGEILLVEDTSALMARMGKKQLRIELLEPVQEIPAKLASYGLELAPDGSVLTYTYHINAERTGITGLLNDLQAAGLQMRDVQTQQSSLEDIFVDFVQEDAVLIFKQSRRFTHLRWRVFSAHLSNPSSLLCCRPAFTSSSSAQPLVAEWRP